MAKKPIVDTDSNLRVKILLYLLPAAVLLGITLLNPLSLRFMSTTSAIRYPSVDHYHFRTQIIIDGQTVDFSESDFQEDYEKGQCSAELPDRAIHFHDNVDQMTHIHWDGMTGGLLLKNYGWNFIGGRDDTLGWRFDKSKFSPEQVSVHGQTLPDYSEEAKFYVYTPKGDTYEQKNWNDFLSQDLETFFGKGSNLNKFSLLNKIFPKASAHGNEEHADLEQINNLIGDVVIFAQQQEPSTEQIQQAFENRVELTESTCGG